MSPLLVRCVFVATNLLDQMPGMEGKHQSASPLLSASYFLKFEHLKYFCIDQIKYGLLSFDLSCPNWQIWDNLPLAVNALDNGGDIIAVCLHNTTAINTVAQTASPHCGSSRRRNTNWNSFVAQITSGTLHLPICPQRRRRHH